MLEAAENSGFDVLTGDLSIRHEQKRAGRRIATVSLWAIGWPIIEPHVAKISAAMDAVETGSFVRVAGGVFERGKRS